MRSTCTCRVWSTKDGRLVRTVKAHRGGVRALAAAPGGGRLYSCGSDNTIQVRLWLFGYMALYPGSNKNIRVQRRLQIAYSAYGTLRCTLEGGLC